MAAMWHEAGGGPPIVAMRLEACGHNCGMG